MTQSPNFVLSPNGPTCASKPSKTKHVKDTHMEIAFNKQFLTSANTHAQNIETNHIPEPNSTMLITTNHQPAKSSNNHNNSPTNNTDNNHENTKNKLNSSDVEVEINVDQHASREEDMVT